MYLNKNNNYENINWGRKLILFTRKLNGRRQTISDVRYNFCVFKYVNQKNTYAKYGLALLVCNKEEEEDNKFDRVFPGSCKLYVAILMTY